jgi:hypothetical protein
MAVFLVTILAVLIQICLFAVLSRVAEERSYGLYISALIGTIGQAAFVFLCLIGSTFATIVFKTESLAPG